MTMEERQVLLETPSGFALFSVSEDALQKPENVWIRFRNARVARSCMYSLGFVKFKNKSFAWDGTTDPSIDLMWLVKAYCNDGKEVYVENMDIQLKIQEKLGIKCCCDYSLVGKLIWGVKNVLHELVPEEKNYITKDYCMPLSTGLQKCFNQYCINLPPSLINKDLISKIGFLAYLDISMEEVGEKLRKYDAIIGNIGQEIQSDLSYGKVLASILVPEFTTIHDFSKMFSKEFVSTIEEVRSSPRVTSYREKTLTMKNRKEIISALAHLFTVPHHMDKVIAYVKDMVSELLEKIELELEEKIQSELELRDSMDESKSTSNPVCALEPEGEEKREKARVSKPTRYLVTKEKMRRGRLSKETRRARINSDSENEGDYYVV